MDDITSKVNSWRQRTERRIYEIAEEVFWKYARNFLVGGVVNFSTGGGGTIPVGSLPDHPHDVSGHGGVVPHSNLTGLNTDASSTAIHHTLGTADYQAAAGTHTHLGAGGTVAVMETDGSPNVTAVTVIKVSPGSLTDNGGGTVTIATAGAGSDSTAWHRTGDTAGAAGTVGPSDAYALSLQTGGTARLHLDADGNEATIGDLTQGFYYGVGFDDNSGGQEMYIFAGANGKTFNFILPGPIPGVSLRDPSIIRWKGKYWIVFTNGNNTNFGIMSYTHLLAYDTNTSVDVSGLTGTITDTWAPKWFVDSDGSLHVFFCAKQNAGGHYIAEIHPTNDAMTTWSTPVFVTGGTLQSIARIDPAMAKIGNTYYLWFKREVAPWTAIGYATSTSLTSGYTVITDIDSLGWGYGIEAPCPVQIGPSKWRVYYELYPGLGTYYRDSSDSFATWTSAALITTPIVMSHIDVRWTRDLHTLRDVSAALMQNPGGHQSFIDLYAHPKPAAPGTSYARLYARDPGSGTLGLYLQQTNGTESALGQSFATPAVTLGTVNAAGTALTGIRSDATILTFDGAAPVTQNYSDTAAAGTATVAARRDHVHGMPAIGGTVVGGGSITIMEIDGAPSVSGVTAIKFSNGTVTDNTGGTVTVTTAGGTQTLTVQEADGAPSVANVNTILVDNGSLTDNGGGTVRLAGGGGGGAGTTVPYVTTASDSGLSAEVVISGLAGCADIYGAAGAGTSEEYDGTATGLTWTPSDPAVINSNTTIKSYLYLKSTDNTERLGTKSWAPAGALDARCKVTVGHEVTGATGIADLGILIGNSDLSNRVLCHLRCTASNVYVTQAFTFASATYTQRGSDWGIYGNEVYLRIVRDGSNNWTFYWSSNGILWQFIATQALTFTVAKLGYRFSQGSAATIYGAVDWLRTDV